MTTIENIIDQISISPARSTLLSPAQCALRLAAVLTIYAVGVSMVLGIRPDLAIQLTRLPYMLEILLLLAVALSSLYATALARYPDVYQRDRFLRLPYGLFIVLLLLLCTQGFLPSDPRMIFPPELDEKTFDCFDCTICIAAVSVLPSALLFVILRRGASVHPLQAGSFAVLAATAVGCLTLRLAEQNDSIAHLATWHYIPTLIFACIGAAIGKFLLKW